MCRVFLFLVGVVGFEPTLFGLKGRCLTAWLHSHTPLPIKGITDSKVTAKGITDSKVTAR